MAGVNIKVELTGDKHLQRVLGRLIGKGQALEPALAEIGEYLIESHQARFELEVAPDGALWEPLSPKTLKQKEDDRILQASGTLRDTLAYQLTSDTLFFGTNQEYGAAHQFGYEDIPARPFIGLFEGQWNDKDEIAEILESHLLDAI